MENVVNVEVYVRDRVLKPVSNNPRHWGCCSPTELLEFDMTTALSHITTMALAGGTTDDLHLTREVPRWRWPNRKSS
jgi:hypothetical protein